MSLLPQFGFIELILVAMVALVVVGPKDLPALLRTCGQMMKKARAMASEFTGAFDQMARDAEMDELRKEMQELKSFDPLDGIKDDVKALNDEVDLAFDPIKKEVEHTVKDGEAATSDSSKSSAKDMTSDSNEPISPKGASSAS